MATPSPVFPGAIATDSQLKIGNNQIQASLRVSCDGVNTILFVDSTAGFAANCLVSIDKEIIAISSVSAAPNPQLTVAPGGRGFDGTAAVPHAVGAKVSMLIVAWHHNALSTEIKAIEQFLGPNGQNIASQAAPFLNAKNYNFAAQSPGGSLAAGANVVTIAPVPPGVNGSNTGYSVYISGGAGTAEAAPVSGGTAVAGAPSGTLIITCANTHSGAWTITSASGGIQEAVCALPANGGVVVVASDVTLYTNVVKAGKVQPSVWKLSGTSVSGSFNVLEHVADATLTEWATGPHSISALMGTFNNRVTGLSVIPEAHDPWPASYGSGIAVGQPDPTKLTMNQFFHGISVDIRTNNPTPNQNAGILAFSTSSGGADPFGADCHGVVPSTATAAPAFVIGVQAETQVDIAASTSAVYPLYLMHESTAGKKATAMITMGATGSGAGFLLTTDNTVMTDEGIVLIPANDLNPGDRAFAILNAAGSQNNAVIRKDGGGFFKSFITYGPSSVVASANAITPPGPVFHISGTAAIATINTPAPLLGNTGAIYVIPDGAFTLITGSNIGLASTAVVGRVMILVFDGAAGKWYPSY